MFYYKTEMYIKMLLNYQIKTELNAISQHFDTLPSYYSFKHTDNLLLPRQKIHPLLKMTTEVNSVFVKATSRGLNGLNPAC